MLIDRQADIWDVWHTWETGSLDCDLWGPDDWQDDMLRSDYFDDMPEEAFVELLSLMAKNRGSPQLTNLVKHTTLYITTTLES